MKCLTIKQPWAWLIFNDGGINKGLKNIENRNWHTNIRGTIAIHTSKKIDIEVYNGLIKYSGFKLPPLDETDSKYEERIKLCMLGQYVDSLKNILNESAIKDKK